MLEIIAVISMNEPNLLMQEPTPIALAPAAKRVLSNPPAGNCLPERRALGYHNDSRAEVVHLVAVVVRALRI